MNRKALVVVLGDLDRSPRMRYHCKSLSSNNYKVSVIATGGGPKSDKLCKELESDKNIKQYLLIDRLNFKRYVGTILAYFLKTLWQSLLLIHQLFLVPKPQVIIVQNPPSIPTLPILYIYSKLRRSKLVIDWHNYGYTILRLNFKNRPNHIMVRVYKFLEFYFGQLAQAGFCVSQAMQKDLSEVHHINYPIYVLYDKPAQLFKPISWKEKHQFFLKMSRIIPQFGVPIIEDPETVGVDESLNWTQKIKNFWAPENETRFSCLSKVENKFVAIPKPDRPALIMSSTSWTEDEDFGLLLGALEGYDRFMKILHLNNSHKRAEDEDNPLDYKPPRIVCVITGKGPMKEYWTDRIQRCNFLFVEIILPWLENIDEYALMVASSDLGISLHQSSSGVDLPMKVVDMFGCGVPVLAFRYKTINELVRSGLYGKLFLNHKELEDSLKDLLINLHQSDNCSGGETDEFELIKYKKNIRKNFLVKSWDTNWIQVARPVLDNLSR